MSIFGQTYSALWKQAEQMEKEDLPRSQYDVLMKIVKKADRERNYGQLLKAELKGAQVMTSIAPDSLLPAVERMETRCLEEKDVVMRTVYETVIWRICRDNGRLEKGPVKPQLTPELCQQLAAVKAETLEPMVVKGSDSKFFDHDLLSLIGMQLDDYAALHTYYEQAGNRRATLLTALELLRQERPGGRMELGKAAYLERLDSLISLYGDLTEAGEVVIDRYLYMTDHTDATAEQRWQYIGWALEKYGSWQRMNVLRQAQRDLSAKQFHAETEWRVCLPGQEQTMKLENLRGITGLTMKVYRVKADGDKELYPNTDDGYKKIKSLLTPMPELTQTMQFAPRKQYELFKDSLTLPGLPVGIYMIEMTSSPQTEVSRSIYYVSNVRVISEEMPTPNKQKAQSASHTIRYVVVDATTGQPIPGAMLKCRYYVGNRKKDNTETLTANAQGEALLNTDEGRPYSVFAYMETDKACPTTNGSGRFYYYQAQSRVEHTAVMTDRSIYRPGQTVHVSAFLYETAEGYKHRALENRRLTLTLFDANRKEVSRQDVVTDRYGTVEADFTLPQGGLTGNFRIESKGGSARFRVEQYKRPTFEVEFPTVKESYEDGDTVNVKATARTYSGVPVQGAKVKYTVVRRRAWWWLNYSRYWNFGYLGHSSSDEEVLTGEAVTEQDGTFTVPMPMVLPKTDYPMFYNFICTADVTDQAGEIRQGQISLPLGNRKTAFSVDMEEQILRENAKPVTFHLRNAAGTDIDGEVKYRITPVTPKGKGKEGKWQTVKTNVQCSLIDVQCKSGRYEMEAICGKDTLEQEFTVFSLSDERPAAETDDWFYVSESVFPRDGSPVTLQVGSSAKDMYIVYSIISGEKTLESGVVKKSEALLNRKFTYKEEYGNGLLLTYAWVKNGRCYSHTAHIRRPVPDERLTLEWHTFRDRLTPGQQEEWSLTVKKPDGTPADAQLMAVLYDKSLDQISKHNWNFTPYLSLPLPETQWNFTQWGTLGLNGYRHAGTLYASELSFSHFDDDAFPSYWSAYRRTRIMGYGRGKALSARAVESAVMDAEAPIAHGDNVLNEVVLMKTSAAADNALQGSIAGLNIDDEESAADEPQQEVQVRENLQETAFFYPRLQTDSTGLVTMKFTLPESLTTWRFMGLAHTPLLENGMLTGEAVAKKDVMIQPNVPRFIRQGDKATISARVFNTGENDVKGTARLVLTDPETDAVVLEAKQPFDVKAGDTGSVTFEVDGAALSGLSGNTLFVCKVTAAGNGFSDGEQHYLPLLPNWERVTVTVPFTQNEPGTKTIDLSSLFNVQRSLQAKRASSSATFNVQCPKLTVEYTNNPAWLMIQALPAVGHPHDDCAVCQAASLYANSIGKLIVDQNPQAKNVFEQWKHEDLQGETSLNSQLEKNQELKDLILNETPWVADADRETEQRQRLADFFDESLMQQRLQQATDKLKDLQRGDGSWSWWPQMPGSLYMTVSITEMLVRLNTLTAQPSPLTSSMLDKSFKFLGHEMVDLVNELKKQEKKGHKVTFPSFNALQWLYVCTLDKERGSKLSGSVKEANDYLLKLLKKERTNQTIYEKAMTAIILNSPQYVKSLKEFTVYKEEMGRYYDTPRAGYSWRDYRIPTQVAAIEALQRLTPQDRQTIDEMRRWLLQEKRTQAWDTPLNSVDAVYAFLNGNSEELKPQAQTVLRIDGQPMELPKVTAGIGYVKTAQPYGGEKIFTAEKTSERTSWGCVYAQFMQPMTDIAKSGSGITVKRELIKDHVIVNGNQLANTVTVGSRITVRITIDCERDLDFVQVQDKCAACMEPVSQLSGYRNGSYCAPLDNCTNYFFDRMAKGRHVVETEYYIDRSGTYETGTCTVQCAYASEYRGTAPSVVLTVGK